MNDRPSLTPKLKLRLAERDLWLVPGLYIIGRNRSCHIPIDDSLASRRHALIAVDAAGSAIIRDLGSINGVFLNGVRIGTADEPLKPGDHIAVANKVIEVGLASELPPGRDLMDTLAGEEPMVPSDLDEDEPTGHAYLSPVPAAPGTGGLEPLEVLVPVLRNMLDRNLADEAEELVAAHLRNLLAKAQADEAVESASVERAALTGLELALARRPGWVDYSIRLMKTQRDLMPSNAIVATFKKAVQATRDVDRALLTDWVRCLRERRHVFGMQSLSRLDQLEAVLSTLED